MNHSRGIGVGTVLTGISREVTEWYTQWVTEIIYILSIASGYISNGVISHYIHTT